jgi:hypothetical protein
MKKLLVLMLSFWACVSVSAQKVYFIYLESDNGLSFYVRTTDRVYSSSSSGYLILPDLVDSSYTLFVGFPSSPSKESKFLINLRGVDRGFSIKQADGGYSLFDLQNLNTIRTVQDQSAGNVSYEARSDAFTTLLSKAAADSSLLMVPIFAKVEPPKPAEKDKLVTKTEETKLKAGDPDSKSDIVKIKSEEPKPIKSEEPKPASADVAISADTISRAKIDTIGTNPVQNAVVSAEEKKEAKETLPETRQPTADTVANAATSEEYKRSVIKKHSESSTSEGFGLVYFDTYGESVDTIRLLIPNPKVMFRESDSPHLADNLFLEVKKDSTQEPPSKKEALKEGNVASAENKPGRDSKPEKNESATAVPKAKCTDQATDNDFFKLRRDMAAEQTDEAMVDEAKKYFKNKCYTTEQVKNLSALFLTSAGKYLFFDAAYMHVADQENFASLQSQIKDDYYLRRFKALIGE